MNTRTGKFELHLNPDIKVLSHCVAILKALGRCDTNDERAALAVETGLKLIELNKWHGILGNEHEPKDKEPEPAKPSKSLIPDDDAH